VHVRLRPRSRQSLIIAFALCLAALPRTTVRAQDAQGTPSAFRSAATAVVVDVIVRDARGAPVRGLTLADFEVRENGVIQALSTIEAVGTFEPRPVTESPTAPPSAQAAGSVAPARPTPAAPGARPPRPGRMVALVFDRLSADGRPLAYKAALSYVETSNPGDRIGVFLSNLSPETIQDYTSDREALRRAVRTASMRAASLFDKKSQTRIDANPEATVSDHPSVPDTAGAEFGGRVVGGQDRAHKSYDERTLEAIAKNGRPQDSFWERLARDQQGYATTNSIEAIAAGLGSAPGRKALVFFAEGLAIPDAVMPHFERAVATANRAQVSVYSVDAKGLRVHSEQAEIRREVGAIGAAGIGNFNSLTLMERNEDVLRKDADTSLRLLANRTGGVLINNTNDLSRVAGVVDLDFRDHYVLTYQPANTDFRGEWRRIEVRVPGHRVTVRARSGYLAVQATPGAGAMLAHEARAQAALDLVPPPAAVPLQVAALTFPQTPDATRVALLVSLPLAAVATTKNDRYDAEFTILARIRDASGALSRTASEPYRVGGPLTSGVAPPGRVLFVRYPELPPGHYRLEVAAADATGIRAGVTRMTFAVPAPAPSGLDVSSLFIVDGAEPVVTDTANPLMSGGRLLYPSLTGLAPAGPDATIALFARLSGPKPSTVRLELRRGGVALSDAPVTLPPADAAGRVDYSARLPIGALPPGEYELRLTVSDGITTIERRAAFRKPG
jgi:VWFA-related protein